MRCGRKPATENIACGWLPRLSDTQSLCGCGDFAYQMVPRWAKAGLLLTLYFVGWGPTCEQRSEPWGVCSSTGCQAFPWTVYMTPNSKLGSLWPSLEEGKLRLTEAVHLPKQSPYGLITLKAFSPKILSQMDSCRQICPAEQTLPPRFPSQSKGSGKNTSRVFLVQLRDSPSNCGGTIETRTPTATLKSAMCLYRGHIFQVLCYSLPMSPARIGRLPFSEKSFVPSSLAFGSMDASSPPHPVSDEHPHLVAQPAFSNVPMSNHRSLKRTWADSPSLVPPPIWEGEVILPWLTHQKKAGPRFSKVKTTKTKQNKTSHFNVYLYHWPQCLEGR